MSPKIALNLAFPLVKSDFENTSKLQKIWILQCERLQTLS